MKDTSIENTIREMLEERFRRVNKFDTEKGGIYVEITDDPRGWMLGDKTRKIYEIDYYSVLSLTSLLVAVKPSHGGNEIKVVVCDSEEIGRMLLSKNDDVGSSIKYADIRSFVPTELTAVMGQHVCIEHIEMGCWIRLQIFPGSNMANLSKIGSSEIGPSEISKGLQLVESIKKLSGMR